MKRKVLFVISVVVSFFTVVISCDSEGEVPPGPLTDTDLLNDFWFGSYQEDALTNPEDPLPGFIYLQIPETGNFDGELYFSYSGCDGGVDLGRVSGTVANGNLDGSWSGNVDGENVGGSYTGELINEERYQGIYTNAGGKVEIECDEDFSYFVAPNGTWFLNKSGNNKSLDISVDTNSDPIALTWKGGNQSDIVYNVVFVDAECLEQNLDLEECLMWSGITTTNSIVYGQGIGETVPAERLVLGRSYLASITCVNSSGEATVSSNIIFIR